MAWTMTCEISGESLATTKDEIVVTPSGHVCIKRFLLQKLIETGGLDPFETIQERPLTEDQLISLASSSSSSAASAAVVAAKPPSSATSFPHLLQQLMTEYDAMVLELFDTRKALEDTRRELSQALYQNDAAVRVIARISMERDRARQELQQWNGSTIPLPTATTNTTTNTTTAMNGKGADIGMGPNETPEEPSSEIPQTKKRRIDEGKEGDSTHQPSHDGPLINDIPPHALQQMIDRWSTLHQQRKPMLKDAAARAPTLEQISAYQLIDTKSWHKSTCKSVGPMAYQHPYIVTTGKDKQIIVYHTMEQVVQHTFSIMGRFNLPISVDVHEPYVVAATSTKVVIFSLKHGTTAAASSSSSSTIGEFQATHGTIVHVQCHPTPNYVMVLTTERLILLSIMEHSSGGIQEIASFQSATTTTTSTSPSTEYVCGALHPDGLIYAAGTKTGAIHMWDLKNKVLASTLQPVRTIIRGGGKKKKKKKTIQ